MRAARFAVRASALLVGAGIGWLLLTLAAAILG